MNKGVKIFLLGLLVWFVPFLVGLLVWDPVLNIPGIADSWFHALMMFSFAAAYGFAAYGYFRDVSVNPAREGWMVGMTWYLILVVMDLLVLVLGFGMLMVDYIPLLFSHLSVLVLSGALGELIAHPSKS